MQTQKMKTFVMSDMHGCYREMMALYRQLPINPEEDRMVFLGDYIDRGPDSKKVIAQLIKWKTKYPHWQVLYGNHEDLMLEGLKRRGSLSYGDQAYQLWQVNGGDTTVKSYLPRRLSAYQRAIAQPEDFIPLAHLTFLRELPRWFEDKNYIYVHGGLEPGCTPEETDPYNMIWIRDEFILSDYDWGKKVIFGHTADAEGTRSQITSLPFQPIVRTNKIGIDTAVCPPTQYGLTALELPAEKFYFQPSFND
jgi:serine/threonine protein phosphatase 1